VARNKADVVVVRVMEFSSIFLDRSLVMVLTGIMRNCATENKSIQLLQYGAPGRRGAVS
jgi:hypothetical protein